MGRYTLHNSPAIDDAIEAHLEIIRSCVLERLHPQAILLSGSFGRGEGSVHAADGQVTFYSDYEIAIVSASPLARLALGRVQRELDGGLPVPVSLCWLTPARLRQNRTRNLSLGPAAPSIHMYELKAASRVLYGACDLGSNLLDPRQLPAAEGLRLLENRMIELIDLWYRGAEGTELAFALAKLMLACGDALLLRSGRYHYSYAERARRTLARRPEDGISPWGDDVSAAYCRAVSFKLQPFVEFDDAAVLDSLPAIRKASRATWDLLVASAVDGAHGAALPPGALPISYHAGPLPVSDVRFENAVSAFRYRKAGRKVFWDSIPSNVRHLSIRQLLYAAIPMFFFGAPPGGASDLRLLKQAFSWSQWCIGPGPVNLKDVEPALARSLSEAWHALN